jgi:predicted RNA-binding protein YlxR (DUF448 family)
MLAPPRQGASSAVADDHIAQAADDEVDAPERGPLRRCVVTREQGRREDLIRFVVAPDGVIVPDLAARLPGRGIWLSARSDVIHSPRLRQAFSRAARTRVEVPDDLGLRVQAGLRSRIADLIGFARRAGQAVAGYQKAHEWLASGKAVLIIQAKDGSADERSRFLSGRSGVAVITPLSGEALGGVFGREGAVHVAIAAGRLAGLIAADAARLDGVDGDPAAHHDTAPGEMKPGETTKGSGVASAVARQRDTDGI